MPILVDVSIFLFFLLGGGEGGVRGDREEGGGLIENPRRGVGSSNESLKHEVVNVLNTLKSGNPTQKLQAITNLEPKSLYGKFVHVGSETLGLNISFLVHRVYKGLHEDILMSAN